MESSDAPAKENPGSLAVPEDVVVQAVGLGKRFQIYLNDRSRFFEFFGRRKHHEDHWALRDVNFSVRRGVSFGIIGANGAGKSTLLKLIAGISEPTVGQLSVRAELSTLLDLGLGFHQSFTGRENIYLNCSLLGMKREEVEERIPDIIAFAELGQFIDFPVRTYSAGMSLRLGFAIAAHLDSDVFLVDEVLAVGDAYFQRKCVHKIEEFMEAGRTIILVTHDLHAIRSVCQEAMWLDHGEVRAIGPARQVVERYLDIQRERTSRREGRLVGPRPGGSSEPQNELPPPGYRATVDDPLLRRAVMSACLLPEAGEIWAQNRATEQYDHYDGETPVVIGSGEVRILNVQLLDGRGHPRTRFRTGEDMIVAVTFRTTEPVVEPILGVAIHRNDGVYIFGPNTRFDGVLQGTFDGIYTYFLHYPNMSLLAGRYRISVAVFDRHHIKPHVWHNQLYDFEVAQEVEDHGLVQMPHAWGLLTHIEGENADVTEGGRPNPKVRETGA
jgi:ABC-type polysaccharide/polyol phosphate transport system ATPase subunit